MATVDEIAVQIVARVEGLLAGLEQGTAALEAFRGTVESTLGVFSAFAEAAGIAFAVEKVSELAEKMAELVEKALNTAFVLGASVRPAKVPRVPRARRRSQRLASRARPGCSAPATKAAALCGSAFPTARLIGWATQSMRRDGAWARTSKILSYLFATIAMRRRLAERSISLSAAIGLPAM